MAPLHPYEEKTSYSTIIKLASTGMVKPKFLDPQKPTGLNPTMSGASFTDNPGGGKTTSQD